MFAQTQTGPLHIVTQQDAANVLTRCGRVMGDWNRMPYPLAGERECTRCGTPQDFEDVRQQMKTRTQEKKLARERARANAARINAQRKLHRDTVELRLRTFLVHSLEATTVHTSHGKSTATVSGVVLFENDTFEVTIKVKQQLAGVTCSTGEPRVVNG